MVKYLAGPKGEGKTRRIIEMANAEQKTTDGHLVFIDDDKRHIFDLHRDIRFVEAGKRELANYREFVGFLLGILSQNSDIRHIYTDGLTNILMAGALNNESLPKLHKRLEDISKEYHTAFTISIHCEADDLPDELKNALV